MADARMGRRRVVGLLSTAAVVAGASPLLAACGAKSSSATTSTSSAAVKNPLLTKSSATKSTASSSSASSSGLYTPALSSNPSANLVAPQATGTVSTDGKIDSTWSKAQQYTITTTSPTVLLVGSTFAPASTPPIQNDVVYLQWDSNYFYVAENRTQTSAGLPVTEGWTGNQPTDVYLWNSLGVFFCTSDPTVSSNEYNYNGHYTIWGTPSTPSGTKPFIWLRAGDNGTQSNTYPTTWPIGSVITSTGYTLTMGIPWSALQAVPWKPGVGTRVLFTLLPTAAGPSGKPWGQIMLVGNGDVATTWGVLTLNA